MKKDLAAAAFFAESLRFTLRLSGGVAPATALGTAAAVRAREVAWSGRSTSPFKPRDPSAQRRLLLAS